MPFLREKVPFSREKVPFSDKNVPFFEENVPFIKGKSALFRLAPRRPHLTLPPLRLALFTILYEILFL